MARSATIDFLGPEFDLFLQAPIGTDRNGMPLSVLSALARMDIDPWQEAARLTALPQDAATRSLEALLASRPGAPPQPAQQAPPPIAPPPGGEPSHITPFHSTQPDTGGPDASGSATAARLIALLPRRAGGSLQPRHGALHAGATAAGHHVQMSMVLWLVLMAILLAMQAVTGGRSAPVRTGHTPPPASSTNAPARVAPTPATSASTKPLP